SHYTLQLSSSSNYDNLTGWAKKENLKNYVVYETTRKGHPLYSLVSGVSTSEEKAKKAVTTYPTNSKGQKLSAIPPTPGTTPLYNYKRIAKKGG
ncbi:SPOR domain-containing protein, partial [Escherichia coli]|uniref:SPOR domain-containing protein n=1 Tax=Escherichia coli TaxID=562 RepID=UPI001485A6E7